MKILMLFHLAPYPPDFGAAKRNYHLFTEALKKHEVTVLSLGTPSDEARFRAHFGARCDDVTFIDIRRNRWVNVLLRMLYLLAGRSETWLFHSRAFQESLERTCGRHRYDLIQCSMSLLGIYRFPSGIPLIGDTHNVEYDTLRRSCRQTRNLFRKSYYFLQSFALKRDELATARKIDVLLATSTRDRDLFHEDLPDMRIEVIPNGVDTGFFAAQTDEPEPRTMVFTGLMNYYPNSHGITFFLDRIFPLILESVPDARVYIVGANPSRRLRALASVNVAVVGHVKGVRPYIARGEISIIPLLIGGGTRLKVLEAMAMRKPIVSTTLGCEGLDIVDGQSAVFADTPQEFAAAVVRLFSDRGLRERLAAKAYEKASDYRWESIGTALEGVYQSLLSARQPSHV